MIELHGSWEDLYNLVPDMVAALNKLNPGSTIKNEVDKFCRFQRLFVCFKACKDGFLEGCRPLLGLDGCHLKTKYKGVILAATALDGNYGMFPTAFCIVDSESGDSWRWFLKCLKEALGSVNGMVFLSDMCKGLEEGVLLQWPQAEHRTCMRHLYKNFKKNFGGDHLEQLVWNAARAYTSDAFNQFMNKISADSQRAYHYLMGVEIKEKYWSRSQFGESAKCHYITNNISESFNAYIGEARWKPIVLCVDLIRQKIMKGMYIRQKNARKWTDSIVPFARKYLVEISRGLGGFSVRRSSNYKAEVVALDIRCCRHPILFHFFAVEFLSLVASKQTRKPNLKSHPVSKPKTIHQTLG